VLGGPACARRGILASPPRGGAYSINGPASEARAMTYTTEEFVRHSLHRILRSVKYRNSFLCLPCLVTLTLESLHRGWRPSEITRALDRIYAAPGVPMESRAAFRCAHCRNVKPCLGSPYL
jgi:hypothetical protein